MGLFLAALAAQGILTSTEVTAARSHKTNVPFLEVNQADAREVIKRLFWDYHFAGTIAPEVQGTITLSLRNVDFDTALQNILRQVEATYRIDHGFFEIVRTPDPSSSISIEPPPVNATMMEVSASYSQMAAAVMLGKGKEFARYLAPDFEARNATETKKADQAVRYLIETQRAYPRFAVEREPYRSKGTIEVLVSYGQAHSTIHFRDSWRESPEGKWVLYAREETALQPSRRFVDVPLSKVLTALFKEAGVSYSLDPSLERNVTIDLTGVTFEIALTRLLAPINATYRIEGGVYQVLPREYGSVSPLEDWIPIVRG
jgi:type II secretory pathway component GspD/PulD (secretin)